MSQGTTETLLGYILGLYAGVILMNLLLSLGLWARERRPLQRSLVLLWATMLFGTLAHGVLSPVLTGPLGTVIRFWTEFPISLSMADLLARVVRAKPPWRRYAAVFVGTALCTVGMSGMGLDFWIMALPSALGVSFPVFHAALVALARPRGSTTLICKATAVSCLLSGLHNLDYPFLGNRPDFTVVALTAVLLVAFAISITAPAVILESVAQERARIEHIDRLKTDFFSNITHELRTPLTMILAPLEGLLEGELGNLRNDQKEYLRPIQRNAFKLLKLINDLLDLAKLDERYLRLRVEQTDLASLVTEIVEHARPLATRKDITLELDIRRAESDLHVDPEKMERALVNLAANALKFTPPGGRVDLWMDATGEEVQVGIRDTGDGIPGDQLGRIFERFSQADGSITRRYGGTGIGLAIAKEIVELHGGRITVESQVGEGSEFILHLKRGLAHLRPEILERRQSLRPTAEGRRGEDREPREWTRLLLERKDFRFLGLEDATERRVAVRAEPRLRPNKVLVVEDNADVLRLVSQQLGDDYDVYLASDGAKGLDLAQRELPDVIVTDYMMPEMDGMNLVRTLRADERTQHIPVIMLTARNQVQDRIDARQAGAEIYLSKPFSPRELRSAVAQLLQQRGQQVAFVVHEQVKSLELISAGLAHEVHNPLNYIRNALFVIQEATAQVQQAAQDPARASELAGVVLAARSKIERMQQIAAKGVERIARIVELVRNYAREGYPQEPTAFCLDDALREMAPLLSPADDHEVEVLLDLAAEGAKVTCIPDEIQRAMGNIWQNALDAVSSGGRVTVRTRVDGGFVVIEVIDDGPGIPRDKIGRIFVPFFTTKDPGQGLGLGLAIAYQVISQAGGTLAVESVEQHGSTFRVRLPVSRAEA